MGKCKNLSKVGEFVRLKRPRLVPKVSVVRTVLRSDGLVESIVEQVEKPKDDYRDQNWRNFQIQTIIQVGSTDLLKEIDPLQVSPLDASDGISRVSISLSNLNDYVKELRNPSVVSQPNDPKTTSVTTIDSGNEKS